MGAVKRGQRLPKSPPKSLTAVGRTYVFRRRFRRNLCLRRGENPRALRACPRTPPRPERPWTLRRIATRALGNTVVFPSGFVRRPARSTTTPVGPDLLGQTLIRR